MHELCIGFAYGSFGGPCSLTHEIAAAIAWKDGSHSLPSAHQLSKPVAMAQDTVATHVLLCSPSSVICWNTCNRSTTLYTARLACSFVSDPAIEEMQHVKAMPRANVASMSLFA